MNIAHSTAQPSPLIVVKNLCRTYEQGGECTHALRDVNFCVQRGEWLAVQGVSGSGKSTLLHILGLLDSPSSGEYLLDGIRVDGLDDTALSALRNSAIGFVFQSFYLIPYASALENVMLPGMYGVRPLRELRQRALRLLEQVGLGNRADFRPSQLSGGQQQRVALARALLNEPPLLLADEPTGQLDAATSAEILDILAQIHADGTTVIVVTHNADTAARAHRRMLFRDGRMVEDIS